jgi:hypothetical protein
VIAECDVYSEGKAGALSEYGNMTFPNSTLREFLGVFDVLFCAELQGEQDKGTGIGS